MKNVYFIAFILVSISLVNAGTRRCDCKAVDAHYGHTIIDFGTIATYKGLLWVRCKRLVGCANDCHNRVVDWACNNPEQCEVMTRGNPIRYYYKAEKCNEEASLATLSCGC